MIYIEQFQERRKQSYVNIKDIIIITHYLYTALYHISIGLSFMYHADLNKDL